MKRTLYLVLLLYCFRAGAQVSMTVQLPSTGVLQKAQLWNIVLVSSASYPVTARITMRLMDATTNQPLLTGLTREVTLTRGARQLQAGDLMPVQYEYLSSAIDRNPDAMLPAGNYLACYSMILSSNKDNQGGEDCIPFVVEPMSPPMLNTPANQSVVEGAQPQFTWLPPAPLNMFTDLNYDMVVTNVREGQSPQEAIQQNIPLYRGTWLKHVFTNYPSGAPRLDTGVVYAWTVTARNGRLFAAQTEVWTFKVNGPRKASIDSAGAYVQLRKELDGAVIKGGDVVQVEYINDADDKSLPYELLSMEDNRAMYSGTVTLARGANRLNIPVGKRAGLSRGKVYLLRLHNSRNEYWQIKFMYIQD
ncbi:hypothetical protein [Chitinophaga vietnamensis]|uniref:hypothetical protein n=1 Tax=Chitinophaga vietnamensis TaxID=2593957 RepID=UPI001178C75A|nr:hypothetical protein [Chitinophaga vietnamensis]